MSNIDLISMAVRNLYKRKLRTCLTVLGVVIGTASIVVMVSLGVGMNENFAQMIEQMGNITVVTVESEAYWNDAAPADTPLIDDNAIAKFSSIKGVDASTPVLRGDFRILSGKYESWTNILGINMDMFERLGYKLESGRMPESADKNGVILGGSVTQNFYNPNLRNPWSSPPPEIDPLNDDFQISVSDIRNEKNKYLVKPVDITVTGITPQNTSDSYNTFMDIETVKTLNDEKKKVEAKYYKDMGEKYYNQPNKGYFQALVKCTDMDIVTEVQEQIREMGYQAWSQGEWLGNMKQMSASLQGLLGAIGAVSLLVAAIGITNTMLMSIYERTREIGVMKVIGATLSDINRLFLTEAALIGFLGGVIGILLSYGLSYLLNNSGGFAFMDMISWRTEETPGKMSIIPVWLCVLALIFSTVIGVISGFLPARRAAKLSALAAIRTE